MKHTAPQFWNYALAFVMIGAGTLAIALEFFTDRTSDWAGLIMIWLGVMVLTATTRKRLDANE